MLPFFLSQMQPQPDIAPVIPQDAQAFPDLPSSPGVAYFGGNKGTKLVKGSPAINTQDNPGQMAQAQPSFAQANNPVGGNALNQELTKGGKLLSVLMGGLRGAAAGAGERTFGQGFQQGQFNPIQQMLARQEVQRGGLQNEMLGQQMQYYPLLQRLGLQKTAAEIGKETAQAAHANAQAQGQQFEDALHQAQTEAANYKDDPNLGLIDLRTGQPISSAGLAPLSQEEALILGKQPGERVPLKLKNTANEIQNRGIKTVQANGRSLLVDNQGNTIRDLGAATPLVVMDRQLTPGQVTPDMMAKIDAVGQGKEDLTTALRTYIRYPGMADAFTAALFQKYPQFNQANFGISKDTMKYFTVGKGGEELNSFRTAIQHADLLGQAAQALGNGNTQAFNSVRNALKKQFGDADVTNFDIISKVYTGEVTKAINAGHVTEGELQSVGALIPNNASPQQIAGAMEAFKQLMASKAQQRMEQYEKGLQAQPAFPKGMTQSNQPPAGSRPVTVNGAVVGYTTDGKTMVPVSGQ